MKKTIQTAWLSFILLLLMLLVAASGAAAQENLQEGDIHRTFGNLEIPAGTTVNGDVRVNMGEVVILGTVNGDVVASMGKVTIHGDVKGNVSASMGQVTVTGTVAGDVISQMGEVVVEGQVGRRVEAQLGSVRIRGLVGEDVKMGLGTLEVSGQVGGTIYSEGKIIRITGGEVIGGINMHRGIVELDSRAVVQGNIFVGEGLVEKSPGARTEGSVEVRTRLTRREVDQLFTTGNRYTIRRLENFLQANLSQLEVIRDFVPRRFHYHWYWSLREISLAGLFILLGFSALAYALFPRNLENIREALEHKTSTVVLWGLLTLLLAPPLLVLTAITIIGIPVAIIAALFLGLAWFLGYAGVAFFLGGRVRRGLNIHSTIPLGEIALGILLLAIISLIPLVRGLAGIAVFVLAVGGSLYTRLGSVKPPY